MRKRSFVLALLWVVAGCARNAGPPAIELGVECATCGMEVSDLRFACERSTAQGWRVYDSIECLLRDDAAGESVLADYDAKSLHLSDDLWVIHGSFPSPMGGGYAAFVSRATADSVAARTTSVVGRLEHFRHEEGSRP